MKINFKILIKYFFLLLITFSLTSCKEEAYEAKINFNNGWKFTKLKETASSDEAFSKTVFDTSSWESVRLPHTTNIEPQTVNDQWQGVAWYRKSFEVAVNPSPKKVFLELEAAMNFSKIWINGMLVSEHHGGYLPVKVDISKYVNKGNNVVAIRLDNTDNKITGPKPLKRLDFNMYGGLYRNAWLHISNKVYISDAVLAKEVAGGGIFITYPKVSKAVSEVAVKANIVNEEKTDKEIKVLQSVFYDGKLIKEQSSTKKLAAQSTIDVKELFSLNEANLWSPKHPNLYHLETKVFIGENEVDAKTTRFGIREFTFDKEHQLYVNGEKTFLRGVNRHQDYPFIGYDLSDNAQFRDAKKIKDAGFNYIRLSHYPQSPAFLDACDELGIVVIDAIMGWQFYNDTDAFRAYCYRSATELIRRDRNRPSVLAWEVSLNETKMPIFFMEELNRIVHAEYPGKNVYSCGWMNDVYDIYLQARQHRILHPHDNDGTKPYSVSEYGDWEYHSKNGGLNQDNLPNDLRAELSSRQLRANGEERLLNQAFNLQESHNDNLNTVAYSDSYWVMYDYNRGYHPDIESSGIMDIFRLPKFGYYFYQSQRDVSAGNVLEIASYWNEKSPLDIKVFSNADEVQLFLNDQLIGNQKPDTDKNSNKLKHPPFTFKIPSFEAGTLKAVGFIDGKQVAETVVKTPNKPTKLKVWIDESGKKPTTGVNDVIFCYIAAVDENGTINPEYSEEINVTVAGDIEIMNPDVIKAEAGIATVLIRVGDSLNGSVSAEAKNLASGKFTF
ncbi:glycoside hydrolase family 2 protein [Polaribacter staleyi]|uniref:glycoside hydrolase family 2 protein n=1 Tax=Polaribacter staleyi TaxID=2022337 RepID=UPI0031BBAA10